jgi:NAD-dependent deacetylase
MGLGDTLHVTGAAPIMETAGVLREANHVVVLTGAGISAESGLPTFRGTDGWWKKLDPSKLATPEAFRQAPELVWEWYEHRRAAAIATQPNPAHLALAALEQASSGFTLITQNVDGLHQRAGSRRVVELHGNLTRARCTAGCGVVDLGQEPLGTVPPVCSCGQLLRPDVVWFGEPLPHKPIADAAGAAQECDVMLVVGTSATVYPAADLPRWALGGGAYVLEVNPEETPLTPLVQRSVRAPAAETLPLLVQAAFGRAVPAS